VGVRISLGALGLLAYAGVLTNREAEYLQGIDSAEIIATGHARKAAMIPASTGLRV
jgi:hypothetical protein